MFLPRRFHIFFLAFAYVALLEQGATNAAESLADAVKAADAKYLSAPDIEGVDNAPKIEAGGGEQDSAPRPQEISQGPVRAALTYREAKNEGSETSYTPVVTIFADGKEVARLEGEDIGFADPPISIQIAEMDPVNSTPEVVVSFYSGGAHCCSDTSVVTSKPDGSGWTVVKVGEFDGGPLLATDLDGDGRYEFATRDNGFLYAFACYACSEAPLQVIAIENGEVKNVTEEPGFRPAHASWLKGMIENVPEDDINGFLAGYVGEKILLGEGKPAWELMLTHYDKESDWGLQTCDQPLNENGDCPGQETQLSFPDALEHMLKENGYKVEK
jgi:hypothetical protein